MAFWGPARSPTAWRYVGCRFASSLRGLSATRAKHLAWRRPSASSRAPTWSRASCGRASHGAGQATPWARADGRSRSRSAEALLATGESAAGTKVDVVVTTEPSGSGPGRTYVAAAAVPLLALGPGADGPGPGGAAAATLALTKRQALRLIAAESFARKLTLLPEG
jgi:hypothetical protein